MTSGFERRDFAAHAVRPRRTSFEFSLETPRHWVNGSIAHTHLMNALHVFLPPFERMITQIVREPLEWHVAEEIEHNALVSPALELFADYAKLSYQPSDKDYSPLARRVLARA